MPDIGVDAGAAEFEGPNADDIADFRLGRLAAIYIGHDLMAETDAEDWLAPISAVFKEFAQRLHPFGVVVDPEFGPSDDDAVEILKIRQRRTVRYVSNRELRLRQMRLDPVADLLRSARQTLQQRQGMAGQSEKRDPHQSNARSMPAILTPVKAEASKLSARRSSVSRLRTDDFPQALASTVTSIVMAVR